MADKFDEALDELKDALTNGEELEAALKAVAADHDLRPEALRNRATLRWGDVERRAEELASSVGVALQKKRAAARLDKYEDIESRLKTGPITYEEEMWYVDYTVGSEWSDLYKDQQLVNQD